MPITPPIRASPTSAPNRPARVCTRGIYANDTARGYVSAYDDNAPRWAHTAETWWSFFAARPWLSGGFVWTGFDYRGEPTPYWWPCINSHFGILDTCGFPEGQLLLLPIVVERPDGAAPAAALELAGQGRPGNRRARLEQLRRGRAVPQRPEPGQPADEAEFSSPLEGEIRARQRFRPRATGRGRPLPKPRSKPPAPRPPSNYCRTGRPSTPTART